MSRASNGGWVKIGKTRNQRKPKKLKQLIEKIKQRKYMWFIHIHFFKLSNEELYKPGWGFQHDWSSWNRGGSESQRREWNIDLGCKTYTITNVLVWFSKFLQCLLKEEMSHNLVGSHENVLLTSLKLGSRVDWTAHRWIRYCVLTKATLPAGCFLPMTQHDKDISPAVLWDTNCSHGQFGHCPNTGP